MYIEISQDERGVSVVKVSHTEASTENKVEMEFRTEQVVLVEVDRTAQVRLSRTRSNGTRIETDRRGDAWLTGVDSRLNGPVTA